MDSSGNPIYQIIMEPGWDAFYVWMSKSDQEAIMKNTQTIIRINCAPLEKRNRV